MTIELSENQLRWLGGLLRGFCSDQIYGLDGEALEKRFLHLLDCEMRSDRVDVELNSRRSQLEICIQVGEEIAAKRERGEYYPGYGTVEEEEVKRLACERRATAAKENENGDNR